MNSRVSIVLIGLVVLAGCSGTGPTTPDSTSSVESETTATMTETSATTATTRSTTIATTDPEPAIYDYENLSSEQQRHFEELLANGSVRSEEKLFSGKQDSDYKIRIRYEGTIYVVHEEYRQSRREVCYNEWSAVNESVVENHNSRRSLNESYHNFSELHTDREREAFLIPFENPEERRCYYNGDPLRTDFVKYNGTYYQPSKLIAHTVVYKYAVVNQSSASRGVTLDGPAR